ncbi:IclR family transcriptional regulator [Tenacibaculum sp. SG-28]|uniref:IclR family transcriptional regulator n=1 Tax=Tenacibaculum sp. SG-28 TaxID=754426 RepID=UPI000CF50E08|nr:IclR family transcriptional regulator [Tenacibaculum sp. SG-28]PQJ22994.1 transcriptional regulator, IclR family protein [Tenacibaculum sp. SG-28]
MSDKKLNLSVLKAFELLEAFSAENATYGVRELANKTGYNKSTVYRLLNTLNHLNIVHQDSNEKYQLGSKLFALGNRVSIYNAIRNITQEPLKQVALEIQETVLLSIVKEDKVFHIDKADSLYGLQINTSIGAYQALHATASGKLLLAFSSETSQQRILKQQTLKKFTKNTIIDLVILTDELKKIKDLGYALDLEELENGLVCIAIPIKNKKNKVIASLSASGPLSRFKMENVSKYINTLKKGQSIIASKLQDFDNL